MKRQADPTPEVSRESPVKDPTLELIGINIWHGTKIPDRHDLNISAAEIQAEVGQGHIIAREDSAQNWAVAIEAILIPVYKKDLQFNNAYPTGASGK